MSQFFTSGGQSTGVSASASVLPVNIQNWFPIMVTAFPQMSALLLHPIKERTREKLHPFNGKSLSTNSVKRRGKTMFWKSMWDWKYTTRHFWKILLSQGLLDKVCCFPL